MPRSRAIASASSWRATAFAWSSATARWSSSVGVVEGRPRVLGAVAGAFTEREPVGEVSHRCVDPAMGGGEQPQQPIDGQRDEEARGAPLGLECAVQRPRRRRHRHAPRRSAPVRSLHRAPGQERAEAARGHAATTSLPSRSPVRCLRSVLRAGSRRRRRRGPRWAPAAARCQPPLAVARCTPRLRRRSPSVVLEHRPQRQVPGIARLRSQAELAHLTRGSPVARVQAQQLVAEAGRGEPPALAQRFRECYGRRGR